MKTLQVKHLTSPDLRAVALVPLSNSDKPAVLDEPDLNLLISLGVPLSGWRYVQGKIVVGRARVHIARIIANADKGQGVSFRDANPLNLCRNNLVLAVCGSAKYRARDHIPGERATYRRQMIKHIFESITQKA